MGRSGNPKGRPKRPKTLTHEVVDILNEPVTVRKGSTSATIPAFEASVRKLIQRAIQTKNLAAIIAFVKLCESYGAMKVPPADYGGGVIVAPTGVDFHKWFEANTEIVPADQDRDDDE
jgi:hypothetical protein